ncbi:murein hydrolase activator EnvC family protein [Polaribacter pacificus]|nr:peptidoglycan DD-metalloendopeptidase family protein [Polaribacter pacificus]
MSKKMLFPWVFLLFVFVNTAMFSQTRQELEAQRILLKEEINRVNKLLFTAQKNEKNALEDLKDLNQKIEVREKLIATIDKEAKAITREINSNQKEIDKLSKELEVLKKDYAEMIFKSYKSKSRQSRIMFLLSSTSFTQAYKRTQYMNQYAAFRKKQGEEIGVQTQKISELNKVLRDQKKSKDTLILSEKEQKAQIELDKKSKEGLVTQIKRKEQQYRNEIKIKQREEAVLSAKIDKIIKDAIAKSNANKGTTKNTGFALTPEAKALAASFEKNKGSLPWPVDNGLVVRRYGTQAHPTLRGITITSTGLHIATNPNANAKSVFNGTVLAIQVLSGGKKAVLVQHGNYITTYNNLENLYVETGDKVVTGQVLGKIFTNKVTGKTILIFALHKETQRQNPSSWILKR